MKRRRLSISTATVLGALLVAAPFVGLVAWQGYDRVASETRTAEVVLHERARNVATNAERFIVASRRFLQALAGRPLVVALDPDRCDPVLGHEASYHTDYANLLVADRSGRVICSAVPQPADPVSVADRSWFRQVIETDAFAIGDVQLGRITGRWVVVLGLPVHDGVGRPAGVIAAPVDLATFGSTLVDRLASPTETVTLVDGMGTVLARVPDPSRWIGQSVRDTEIGPLFLAGGQGTAQVNGLDGVERLYAYVPVPGADWQVAAGIPTAEAFAAVRQSLTLAALIALIALIVAAVAAGLAGRLLTRPVRALADATGEAARGDPGDRVDVGGFAETAALAERFNEMLERRAAAEAAAQESGGRLRLSERNLAEAQRIAHLGSWEWNVATDTSHWSDETCRIYGIEPGTFDGRAATFFGFVHPDDHGPLQEAVRTTIEGSTRLVVVFRIIRPDGSLRTVHEEGEVIRDKAGNPVRIVGTVQDITEQVATEEERARLTLAVEQASDTIMVTGPDGTIQYVNPSFERLYGYPPEEVVGRNVAVLSSGRHDADFWASLRASIAAGRTWAGSIVNRCRDGTLVEVEKVVSALRDADGRLIGYVQADRDVTRERALEAQLRQAQKMEAIGQLAGGIAHDFNNLLTPIRGYAELVRKGLPADDEQNRADLDEVIATADRAAELARRLLAFSRRQVLQPRVVDPAAVVTGIAPLLRRLLGESIELATSAEPGRGSVRVDPGQLEQAIVNLAINARDAMPAGGRLTLEIGAVELDAEYARSHPEVTLGPHVLLAVSDTGIGMDPDTQTHIFEPFFTTKPAGKGTGLGLATVYGFVKQSGGSIEVYSEPGAGTSFKIYLPRVEAAAEPLAETAPGLADAGSETVLLVEDDAAVRGFAARVLAERGYIVLEAPDAETALGLAAARPGPIELLLTDVVMPRVSGPELAARLAAERPDLRVLYTSGYAESHLGRSDSLAPDIAYLPKPFTADALARAIRDALERPRSENRAGS